MEEGRNQDSERYPLLRGEGGTAIKKKGWERKDSIKARRGKNFNRLPRFQ